MKIDLCVVNHNTQSKLARLIDSLTVSYIPDIWELYIADNGSTDGSVDWLRGVSTKIYTMGGVNPRSFDHFNHSNIIKDVVYNRNYGYSYACNQLAAMGSNEIIGLLNADTWLLSDDVQKIIEAFEVDSEMAILGPKQRDETGRITHAGILGTEEAPKLRGWREMDREDWLYKEREECVSVSGSMYFIRRSVWDALTNCMTFRNLYPDAVGAFLPTPHYYEETWCSYHARAHGYKAFYDGTISCGHSWHASSKVGGEADKLFSMSREIFRKACDFHSIPHD